MHHTPPPTHTRAHTHTHTHTCAGEDNTEDNTTRTPIRPRTDFTSAWTAVGTAVHGSDQHFGEAVVRRLKW